MRFNHPVLRRLPLVSAIALVLGARSAATNPSAPQSSPLEPTQIGIAIQQASIDNTRAALQTGVTQTALAANQAALVAQMATSTPTIAPTVSTNNAWTPVMKTFDDGVVMLQVPPGCFNMGGTGTDLEDSQPVNKVCFDQPFWIDKTDVTNGQFSQLKGKAANASRGTRANQPRESITWFEARDFCALRGARLPTEAEWEFAARGPDSLTYPWGNNAPTTDRAVYSANQTADVGSKPKGASWVGALDMAGNVWQWVQSSYRPYPYNAKDGRNSSELGNRDKYRVLRGGSFDVLDSDLRSALRNPDSPDLEGFYFGFRCARSDTPAAVSLMPSAIIASTTVANVPATAAPVPTVSVNKAWTPVAKTFDDGVVMVQVPPGCFNMGSRYFSDAPVNKVCFDQAFWIDKTDVTNDQFSHLKGSAAGQSGGIGPNQPRESITWFEARDFCMLRGARLPTEAEWEFAARGPDALTYPWGNNAPTSDLAVYGAIQTADVGSKPKGASWVGALDMAGNVSQWVQSSYRPYPYNAKDGRNSNELGNRDNYRVLRGGSFGDNASDLRSAVRIIYSPDLEYYGLGFRCARS